MSSQQRGWQGSKKPSRQGAKKKPPEVGPGRGSQVEKTKALQEDNFLPKEIPTDGTKNEQNHTTARGQAMLTERDDCTERAVHHTLPTLSVTAVSPNQHAIHKAPA